MISRLAHEGIPVSSLRQINRLPSEAKRALYRSLIPERALLERCAGSEEGSSLLAIEIQCQQGTAVLEIDVRYHPAPQDPVMHVQMADTASGQLEVLLLIVNDPRAPRFDIDRDWRGESTKLGTLTRNVAAEVAAMEAGLAPGQVRRGLRMSYELVPVMERFAACLGKDRFFIAPLAYHNAIAFERHGFAYMIGRARMEQIHRGFQPGGALAEQLDGSTPFRQPGAQDSIRGRSWAIHDGVLGEPWSGIRMYKRVGQHAGVCSFPGAVY